MAYGNGGAAAAGPMQGAYGGQETSFAPPSPARTPQVALEAERMAHTTERLHALISEFENRINAIVRPEGPAVAGTGGDNKQASPSVALASVLAEMNNRFDHACGRLQSLLNRVEL